MGFTNGEFSWHVWHKNPTTGVRKWCGQFLNPESAMGWKKKQENPGEYVVNNVGPGNLSKSTTTTTSKRPSAIDIKAAERAAQREAERKRFTNRKTVAPPVPETAEQKKMKADAVDLMEKHKADEAADLAAGIDR